MPLTAVGMNFHTVYLQLDVFQSSFISHIQCFCSLSVSCLIPWCTAYTYKLCSCTNPHNSVNWSMTNGWSMTNCQTNATQLVWGLLRLTSIIPCVYIHYLMCVCVTVCTKAWFTFFLLALCCDRKCIWNDLDVRSYAGIELFSIFLCARPNHFICTSGHNATQAKRCEPGLTLTNTASDFHYNKKLQ